MNDLKHIYDVTVEDFQAAVLDRSSEVPVLVDYWAEWCGPCKMQLPVLKKLITAYAGQLLLAKVNTEEQTALARDHGIRSLPTMRLFKDGAIVEEIIGAQSEATLCVLLDKYVSRPSDKQRLEAQALAGQGKITEALEQLLAAAETDPDNHRIALDLAALQLQQGDCAAAGARLDALPRDIREEPEAVRLYALLGFAQLVQDAPAAEELETRIDDNPEDLSARHQLAALQVLADNHAAAMQHLLYILQHDRKFGDDAGRKGLLAIFDLLGNTGDLVADYRRKLFNSLH